MSGRAGWMRWALFVVSMTLYGLDIVGIVVNGRADSWSDWSQLSFAVFAVMGILIAVRQPKHAMSWLFLAEGLASALTAAGTELLILLITTSPGGRLDPDWAWAILPTNWASGFLWLLFFIIILLFPDGRLPSSRWRPFAWVATVIALITFIFNFRPEQITISPGIPKVDNPLGIPALAALAPLWSLVQLLTIITGMVCFLAPVLRYRSAGGVERQQLKWLVVGAGFLIFWVAAYMLSLVLTLPPLLKSIIDLMGSLGAAVIPVVMTFAILRYRLYDIDLIIRRTLIYAVLTFVLAGLYFGGVALIQSLLKPLTGEGNDPAIVATTLIIAALFLPLRQRVQRFIGRRFYRRKYDVAKTIAAFSDHVRDEVELDKLVGRLVEVVDETIQPAHISLWLRDPGHQPGRAVAEDLPQ
jgi:hypothetical protein